MLSTPFYDPEKSYEENFGHGPFGAFANGEVLENEGEPQYDFCGLKVYFPFGIPAGPLLNGRFCHAALIKGFDIIVYKTVRSRRVPSHPWPNVLAVEVDGDLTLEIASKKLKADSNYVEPLSITNSFGVPSMESGIWQKDITELVRETKKGQVVVGAFQGTKVGDGNLENYINDFCLCARLLKQAGVQVFEVNLSCPNEGTNAILCYDTDLSVRVVQAIKKEIGALPLVIKIGYFADDLAFKNFIEKIGSVVQGISAINTIPAEIVDEAGAQALPGAGRERSGVCGHSIKWAGLDMVKRLKKLRDDFNFTYTILGVGGVSSPEDFMEYREAGADAVMSATGAMWNPYLAEEIKDYLKNNGK